MAFKMNRPIIKGTANHKASIAKTTAQSEVSQSRTKADAGLVGAADALGKSYKPQAIDFELDKINIDVPEKKEKKKLTPEEQAAKDAKRQARKDKRKEVGGKIVEGVETTVKGIVGVPVAVGYGLYKVGEYIVDKLGNIVKDNRKVKGPKEEVDNVEKVKKPKEKKDTWYDDVDEDGNVISRGYQSIKDKIKAKREQNELDFQAKQEEKNRIQSEKDAAKLEADKLKQAELNKELEAKNKLKEAKTTASADYTVNKRDLVLKEGNWVPKKGAVSKEADRAIWDGEQWTDNPKYMDKLEGVNPEGKLIDREKKAVIEVDRPIVGAVGDQQINQYTKEQRNRLKTEGVWSDDAEKMVLPEEIVDGKFVSKAEGTKMEIYDTSKSVKTEPVVEKKKTTTSNARQRRLDKKYENAGPSVRANMIADGYVPPESKTAMKMRDNRIYRNAVKGGIVQQNMIKSGYIPE